jgi:GNAT superfamily N-acetyltransferase
MSARAATLRPMSGDDLDAVRELVAACDATWKEWAPDGWEPPTLESARWISELDASDRWTRLAVEDDGRVVGLVTWGAARIGPQWRVLPGMAHVGALFVHPDRWRHGVASWLLAAALDAMRADGYRRARLNTPVGAPAERFYAARGWTRGESERWHQVVRLRSVEYTIEL